MLLTEELSILILGLTIGALYTQRSYLVRYLKYFLPASAALIFGILSYWSVLQYRAFQGNPLGKLLLPPHESAGYFFSYVGTRFFSPWLLALLAAIVIARVAEYFNARYEERFFAREEFSMMRVGIFLAGYPGFLLYIVAVLGIGVLLSLLYAARGRGRAPFYHLWLPVAIVVIIVEAFVLPRALVVQFNL